MPDYYADFDNFFNRLVKWYETHGSLIIAYDFDDTVHNSYHIPNATYDHVVSLLRRWQNHAAFICYTARENEELGQVKNYLLLNDIPFDYINREVDGRPILGKKVYYNILLDDKCGLDMPCRALEKLIEMIENGEVKPHDV